MEYHKWKWLFVLTVIKHLADDRNLSKWKSKKKKTLLFVSIISSHEVTADNEQGKQTISTSASIEII